MTEETNLSNTRDTLQWKDLLTKTVATETVLAMETVEEEVATPIVAEEVATETVLVMGTPMVATEDTPISTLTVAEEVAMEIVLVTDVPRAATEDTPISTLIVEEEAATGIVRVMDVPRAATEDTPTSTLIVEEEAATGIVRVMDVPRAAIEDTLTSIPIAKEALRIEEATDVRKVPENVVISMLETVVLSDILPSITDSTTTPTTEATLVIEKAERPITEEEEELALAVDTAITGLEVSVADVPADTVADMALVLIVADLPARLLR
jgi:hypothetical protein